MVLTSRLQNSRLMKTLSVLFFLVLTLGLDACSLLNWGEKNDPSTQQSKTKPLPELPIAEPSFPVGEREVEVIELPLPEFSNQTEDMGNTVVAILQDVEIQYETPMQIKQICRVLADMATLSVSDLQKQRYADFQGVTGQWTVLQVLYAYFLPTTKVDLSHFYDDLDKPLSREIVQKTLEDINTYCEPNGVVSPVGNVW